MSRSIRILPEVDAPIASIRAPKSDTGIVGFGVGAHTLSVRGPYQSLVEVGLEMNNAGVLLTQNGPSANYHWGRDLMANGARRIYMVEPVVAPAIAGVPYDNTMSGDGATRVFDMNGGGILTGGGSADPLTLSPIPGTLHIEVTGAPVEYGTDWLCDWSRSIIYFAVAPVLGVDNITVDWREYTVAGVTAALALLESVPITLCGGAFLASINGAYNLVAEVRDHVDLAGGLFNYRHGFLQGYYQDVAGIAGLAYNNDHCSYLTNREGYYNDNLATPANTWKEFRDPTAMLAGIAASREPWVSMHEKQVINSTQVTDFNSTDVATLAAAWVNYFATDARGTLRMKNGFNSETAAATYRYIDSSRLWIYIGNSIYFDLLDKNIIGNIQVERSQILAMEQMIINTLIRISNEGGIEHPRWLPITHKLNPVNSMLIDAIKKSPEDRSPAEEAYIQAAQISRAETIRVYYDALGSIHWLDIYLGGR